MLHQSHVSELISAYETRRPDQLEEEVKRHLQEIALEEAIPPAEKEKQPQTVPQTISGKPIKPPLGGFHQAHVGLRPFWKRHLPFRLTSWLFYSTRRSRRPSWPWRRPPGWLESTSPTVC